MGTTPVKLYNKTLEDNRTMEMDNGQLAYLTVDPTDEDFFEDQYMRKNIIKQILIKYPTWSEDHIIYCTANCGEWYRYNPKHNNFYKE